MKPLLDLEAIKARIAKTTPGPWEWSIRPKRHMLVSPLSARGFLTVLETQGDVEADYPCAKDADRDLIQHAPTDLAALVAEVERLRAELTAERADAVDYLHAEAERIRRGESEPANRESALIDAARSFGRGGHRSPRKEG
jgi:hypothetical protein